ncbi:KH domain-containing protein [Bdellovibrio bacteriovorus]|uniref:KH domain-containing protein n=1 Tax=Bdellovibrio TaxID=958 RepID=UPI0035A8DE41
MRNSNAVLDSLYVEEDKDEIRKKIAAIIALVIGETASSDGSIKVSYYKGEKTTVYKLEAPPEHRGRIIGVKGKNILSLRTLVCAMAANHGFRAVIDLVV